MVNTLSPAQLAAETIREQVGGRAFVMFGTTEFLSGRHDGPAALTFNVKGSRLANKVNVQLMPDDTYTVTFYKARGLDCKGTGLVAGIHAEQLAQALGDKLGLAVRL